MLCSIQEKFNYAIDDIAGLKWPEVAVDVKN